MSLILPFDLSCTSPSIECSVIIFSLMNLMAATEAEEGEKNQIQEVCDCHLSNGNLLFLTYGIKLKRVINVHHGHSQSHSNSVLTSGAPDFGVC